MNKTRLLLREVFPPMTEVVPPGKSGSARVSHFSVTKHDEIMSLLTHRPYINSVDRGRYARLVVGDEVVMSDTTMERRSNYSVVLKARGDVLVAGLGLGMVLIPILKKPEVLVVTVVEKNPDVIKLVERHVRRFVGKNNSDKLTVVHDDIFSYRPTQKFDVIYFDIWNEIDGDNLPSIAKLHQKFKSKLKRSDGVKPWMNSWMANYLRSERKSSGGWR